MLVETKQQSLGTPCSSWLRRCRLYKAKGGSQHITFPFPHSCFFFLCVCALVYTYAFSELGGGTLTLLGSSPPPNTKVMTSSVTLVFYFSHAGSEVSGINRRAGWRGSNMDKISWQGQTLSHWGNKCFCLKMMTDRGAIKTSSRSNYWNRFWHWDTCQHIVVCLVSSKKKILKNVIWGTTVNRAMSNYEASGMLIIFIPLSSAHFYACIICILIPLISYHIFSRDFIMPRHPCPF